jgi:hypothetical protein
MGVDTNIHIGPYMIVKGKKTEFIDREVLTCSNKKCQTYKDNKPHNEKQKFCAECGNPVEIKKYKEKWVSDANDLINDEPYGDEFVDELCWTDPMGGDDGVFIANERSPFEKKRGDVDDDDIIDFDNIKPEEEKEWFKKRYKKIIDVFHKEFGENSVTIKYGMFKWYS